MRIFSDLLLINRGFVIGGEGLIGCLLGLDVNPLVHNSVTISMSILSGL